MFKTLLIALALLSGASAIAAVDVNQASAAELDGVNGIGPAMSSRILDERKKGPFKDWEDLIARVKGMGKANAQRFSAQGMTVAGAPFAGSAQPAPQAPVKPPK